jgi:RNA polymerase sigma-70 factor (ECF subfamily)
MEPFADHPAGPDRSALAEAIVACRPQLLAYIQRRLGTALRQKVEAEDVLQEACAEAVRVWPVNLGNRSVFAWLCQIAEARLVDQARRFSAAKRDQAREVPLAAGSDTRGEGLIALLVASLTTPSQAVSRQARHQRLHAALNRLSDEQRLALTLRYLENWPTQQIAEQLGKSDGAVRVLLTRALKQLQRLLDDAPGASPPP